MALNQVGLERLGTSVTDKIGENKNILINGAAQVNQRGDQTGITSSTYSVDRFRVAISGAGTWSFSQVTDSPDGFANSVKLDCTTAAASPGLVLIQQRVEGKNLQAFAKGTSSAKQFAVSFYVKTNKLGVYTVELKDDDNSRTVSKTITVANANWNRYTLVFPADTTGAFGNDTGGSLYVSIWLGVTANSTYTNGTFSDGTWAALVNGNRVSNSNANLADSTSNEFLLTGVQLEVGSVVTDFEHRSFAQELELCKRYYQQIDGDSDDYTGFPAYSESATSMRVPVQLHPAMRAAFTVSKSGLFRFQGATNDSANSAVSFSLEGVNTSFNACTIRNTSYSGMGAADRPGNLQFMQDGSKLKFDAEL